MSKLNMEELYSLDYIIRYSNVPRVKNETVAAHSFFVALEVYKLFEEYDFNLDKAIHMSLCHDLPEAYIDDVNHKIKKDYPAVAKALKVAERLIVKSKFPKFIQDFINSYEEHKECEAIIVTLADIIQCSTYSRNELNLGNRGYMEKVYLESVKREEVLRVQLKPYLRTLK